MRASTTTALLAGTASLVGLLSVQPAQATYDQWRCTQGALGSNICIGTQIESGAIRGYAGLSDLAGGTDLLVTVRALTLQRRVCGGTWQSWTTTRTTNDRSTTRDTDVTTYVVKPRRVQWRSIASYSVEDARPPYTGRAGTAVSPVYGAC